MQSGSRGERQRAAKLFLPSGDPEKRGMWGTKTKRGRKKGEQTERTNWCPEPEGSGGPYGRQHFALRFIAHLAVLINGKPVHRA